MSLTTEELLDAALALPDPDRLEFVEALAASLQPADRMSFDESWRELIQRCSAELRNGEVAAVPWADVEATGKLGIEFACSHSVKNAFRRLPCIGLATIRGGSARP